MVRVTKAQLFPGTLLMYRYSTFQHLLLIIGVITPDVITTIEYTLNAQGTITMGIDRRGNLDGLPWDVVMCSDGSVVEDQGWTR